ncbi:MAG: hypothetical protein KAI43_07040 [Candidatus Aureabacteria bacterium]|nr:hypothetical protein [Candidatus Auribacterota bacterium]
MDENPLVKNESISPDRKAVIQKFITLGELTASISHELKNLLISINGYCELIDQKLKNKDSVEEEIVEIKKAASLAQKIFMEILSFSRGGTDKELPSVNINELIEDTLMILQTIKKTTFIKNLDKTLNLIPLDPQKIKQVLINMIMNGVDALNNKKGSITITSGKLPSAFGIFVKIHDTGCGMSEETTKKLFQPFFTTKGKGTGLGLSVCWDIMSLHNGYIHVESAPEKGSTFSLVFLYNRFKPHKDIVDL